uniref:Uncharacterized protein n=1 Tax=Tanacetum cinerariifolium TaxID=118510 RepID=A0A6L2JVC3_TANCI|nr:hypothetical protein [Tanacetum cinerariifolium]
MEAGFLLNKDASKKGGLAAKVINIKGKLLGKDGKPLKLIFKRGNVNPKRPLLLGVPRSDHINISVLREHVQTMLNANDNTKSIHTTPISETAPVLAVNTMQNHMLGSVVDSIRAAIGLEQNTLRKVQVLVLNNDEKI